MPYLEDPWELAAQERAYQRRRALRAISGWLREKRSPKLTVAWLVAACTIIASLSSFAFRSVGLHDWGACAGLGVLLVWPVFILLLRWRAGVAARSLDLGDRTSSFIALEEASEHADNHQFESERWDRIRTGISAGCRSGGQSGGPFAPVVFFLLIMLSCGLWLIWDLIRSGPRLLAEAVLDEWIFAANPALAKRVQIENWRRSVVAGTGVYFWGVAVAVFCIGTVLRLLPIFSDSR